MGGSTINQTNDENNTDKIKHTHTHTHTHTNTDIGVKNVGEVCIYSRNSENMTGRYPDLVEYVLEAIHPSITSCVIDGEVTAVDGVTGQLLPFQTLTTRKKKDVKVEDVSVCVCLFPFDIILLNGAPLVNKTLRERRTILREAIGEVRGRVVHARGEDCDDAENIQRVLHDAVDGGCEGLMVKCLDDASFYEPSKRSRTWLKIKKDYIDGMTDSVDLVPIGGYHGKGKRSGFYGAFLLAVYDVETESYQTVCRVGTGFSEEFLTNMSSSLADDVITDKPHYFQVHSKLEPDAWFDAKRVWEVKGADLSISPVHFGAVGKLDPHKGIGIRFPRFIRERDDKKPEDATNSDQILEMYSSQAVLNKKSGDPDENSDANEDTHTHTHTHTNADSEVEDTHMEE
eukprot:GHVR01172951.1.p1 GENE.GHVR01172951.1~~GHVR01172951.1.p1  ORF type:complete len:435 (+),score=167.16 GHVR01172951.1:109-1305(+)